MDGTTARSSTLGFFACVALAASGALGATVNLSATKDASIFNEATAFAVNPGKGEAGAKSGRPVRRELRVESLLDEVSAVLVGLT